MPLTSDTKKVMFEIYREAGYGQQYRVVFFTELDEHNKEQEISRAMAGEHFYDGFIRNFRKDEAKEIINSLLGRMNEGERIGPAEIEAAATGIGPTEVEPAATGVITSA